MVDVCSCDEQIVRDATKDELGPAYQAYKDGKSFDQKYRESKELSNPWYGDCCRPDSGDFSWEDDSDQHYILLAIFAVLCLLTLLLWRALSDHQALKARKWGIVATQTGNLILLHAVTTLGHTMGPSSSCVLQMMGWFVFHPQVLFHYANATLRLLFIHKWSQTKLKDDANASQLWYFDHQYFLKTYMYLRIAVGVAITGAVMIIALHFSQEGFFGGSDALWTVTRCSWWQIPQEYQTPTLTNGFCNCADYGFYDETMCVAGIQDLCSGGDPMTDDMCAACGASADTYDSSSCQKKINDLLLGPFLDQCGWYSETPDFTTCRACVEANTTSSLTAFVYIIALASLGLIALWSVMKMRDRLGILQEITTAYAVIIPCYAVLLTQMLSEDARLEFTDGWEGGVSLTTLLSLIIVWWSYLSSVLIPFFRAFFAQDTQPMEVTTRASIERFVSLQMRSAFSIGRTFKGARETDLEGANAEHVKFHRMLQFCFDNQEARDLYQQFAAQEFTVENLQFLAAINEIVRDKEKLNVTDMGKKALDVFDTYVCKGARLQVNISHTVMDEVTLQVMGKTGVTAANRNSGLYLMPIPNSIEDVLRWFRPAIEEVQNLIQRDSWPRFMKTKGYKRLVVIFESNKSLHDRLRKVGGDVADNATSSPRRNTPRRGSLDMSPDDDDENDLQSERDVIMRDHWLL